MQVEGGGGSEEGGPTRGVWGGANVLVTLCCRDRLCDKAGENDDFTPLNAHAPLQHFHMPNYPPIHPHSGHA